MLLACNWDRIPNARGGSEMRDDIPPHLTLRREIFRVAEYIKPFTSTR